MLDLDDIQGDLGLNVRRNGEIVQTIRKSVIEAKIALSSELVVKLDIELPGGKRYQREITRQQFEALMEEATAWPAQPDRSPMLLRFGRASGRSRSGGDGRVSGRIEVNA